jgi:hypothetical protein
MDFDDFSGVGISRQDFGSAGLGLLRACWGTFF